MQPAGVFGQLLDREPGNHPLAQPVVEAAQIASIGHDRIRGQMALALQITDKGLDPGMVDGQRSLGGGSQQLSFRRRHAAYEPRAIFDGNGGRTVRPSLNAIRRCLSNGFGMHALGTETRPGALPRNCLNATLAFGIIDADATLCQIGFGAAADG